MVLNKVNNRPNSIRNYLALFAKVFSNIYVSIPKKNGIYMKKVPIHFGPAMKHHRTQDENYKNKRTDIDLPVMGFTFLAPVFDSSRALNKTERVYGTCYPALSVQNLPVPYIIPMTLYIKTKTINELLEIIEQILPHFAPSLTFEYLIYNHGNIAFKDEVVLTVTSTTERLDNWEEPGKRDIEWQLDFEFKAYLFKNPQGTYRNYPIVDKDDNIIVDYVKETNDVDNPDSAPGVAGLINEFKLTTAISSSLLDTDGNGCIDTSNIDIEGIFEEYQSITVGPHD